MEEYIGLSKIRNVRSDRVFCPDCRNYLEVVGNGFFGGDLFFCPKEKKIFAIYLRDMTKKAGEKYIKQCGEDIDLIETRRMVNKLNFEKVKELLNAQTKTKNL